MISRLAALIFKSYLWLFGRPSRQRWARFFLELALKGVGYNNHGSVRSTGELHVIRLLNRIGGVRVLDIGANIGDYSKEILTKTRAEVFACEPLPLAVAQFESLSAEFNQRLRVIPFAIGEVDGVAHLMTDSATSEGATLAVESLAVGYLRQREMQEVVVPVRSLDSLVSQQVLPAVEFDLIKIDTEGWELEVLDGAQGLLKNIPPKLIQLEMNWHHLFRRHTLQEIAKRLNGYVAFQLLPHGAGLSERELGAPTSNVFCYSNFVFVRKDVYDTFIKPQS